MKRLSEKRKAVIVFSSAVIVPLLLGTAIYLLFAPSVFLSRFIAALFPFANLSGFGSLLPKNAFTVFLRGWFCDMCWAFSLESCVLLILPKSKRFFYLSFAVSVSFSLFIELLQKYGVIAGVFDVFDMIVETLAVLSAGFIIKIIMEEKT